MSNQTDPKYNVGRLIIHVQTQDKFRVVDIPTETMVLSSNKPFREKLEFFYILHHFKSNKNVLVPILLLEGSAFIRH